MSLNVTNKTGMKKLSTVILTSLISCSERKEVSEPAIRYG
jgi:hypothetical protein